MRDIEVAIKPGELGGVKDPSKTQEVTQIHNGRRRVSAISMVSTGPMGKILSSESLQEQ